MTNKLRSLTRHCVSIFELGSYLWATSNYKIGSFDSPRRAMSQCVNDMSVPFPNSRHFFSSPGWYGFLYISECTCECNHRYIVTREEIDHERTDRSQGRQNRRKGRGWGRVLIGARTHVNLSAASRCYRGATLMRCILSILLRARRAVASGQSFTSLSAWLRFLSSRFTVPPPPRRRFPLLSRRPRSDCLGF